ncbi:MULTISPECIES: metalloregulator ArsR/SmtB family transcription factor [Actinomadura]|uniref:Metalloregulator ArsR/SmtB family transcription factor n=1 Tax=Actinomadura litoris TaxID=2678616 RepID=A0A7K1LE60_9ACTN|nr:MULTISPECIES: metalloregulator ArsR/SmtB family transcription factor [Actinomadura]MBT2212738.1 ArsR family transcriptional regulator [Actinomadura sp. NEAU-AAG7]MUN42702.1 metalloregulator ArsR/SmtB family transcription factor [Actinomadura litoris]
MADTHKIALYEQFSRVGKALANPVRLILLDLLAQGERSVEDLADAAGMKVGNTSAQLKILAGAGLLATRRSSVHVYYRLADEQVGAFVDQVQEFAAARLAEVEWTAREYLGDLAALEPVAQEDLARRIDSGDVVVVDVRPPAEYEAGHIAGAINVPNDELVAWLAELPHGSDVIAYCRGRYCVLAPKAVRLLRSHGYRARLLAGGMPEWRRAGRPVTSG